MIESQRHFHAAPGMRVKSLHLDQHTGTMLGLPASFWHVAEQTFWHSVQPALRPEAQTFVQLQRATGLPKTRLQLALQWARLHKALRFACQPNGRGSVRWVYFLEETAK